MQLLCELVLRGPASWRAKIVASSKGADCVKRLDGLHGLLSRAVLKEGGNTATAAAKPGGKKAPAAKAKGAAAIAAQVDFTPRAPECIRALKAVLAALAK